ncbi:putative effector related to avrK1 and avra10 (EKA) [Blumeria hordei DH14]|uniref:Putative effector related to avrK1 and avra10 (EKA) n=1 Tax=Blumeria graminis f. sp. hordei (strain DH14) TaxID=546991 RepID=N1JGD0_BLUG1|nr:putative effector related to avrK1 and avra10 (EKA) [Blumeria hordei DH14]
MPTMKRTTNANSKKTDEVTSTTAPQNTIPRTSENNQSSCSDSNSKNTATCPPELRAILEAEEQQAAQTAFNLMICTATINGVENALAPLSKEPIVQFIDSMKVYFRATVAQFMYLGPGTVLPNLPSRPNCQNHGGKIVEKTMHKQPELLQKKNQTKITSAKPTWATVTPTGLHTPIAPVKDVWVRNKPPTTTRPPAKASKTALKAASKSTSQSKAATEADRPPSFDQLPKPNNDAPPKQRQI